MTHASDGCRRFTRRGSGSVDETRCTEAYATKKNERQRWMGVRERELSIGEVVEATICVGMSRCGAGSRGCRDQQDGT